MADLQAEIYVYDGKAWLPSQATLYNLQQAPISSQSCLVFLQRAPVRQDISLRASLERYYGINDFFWSKACERHNGYFGSQDVLDETSFRIGHNSWFRFQIKTVSKVSSTGVRYNWSNLTFHISWRAPDVHHVLCFDADHSFQQAILAAFQKQYSSSHVEMFTPYLAISSVATEAFDTSVWAIREWIRDLEQKRMSKKRPETDYPLLHELTRHTHHSTETISIAVETLSKIRNESCILSSTTPTTPRSSSPAPTSVPPPPSPSPSPSPPTITTTSTPNPQARLQPRPSPLTFHLSLLQGLQARSLALESRLKNELNLAINMVAQEQSQATVRISQATQNDSAAMRAVAVVTLVFLPSTFVTTFFSMSFFSGGGSSGTESGSGWGMSAMIWLYFVITVPMTGMAVLVWLRWERRYREMNALGK